MKHITEVDILVAGGGSAGFGAAYSACLHGKGKYRIAVVDSNEYLGGTSTAAGVNAWEMGIAGPGVHREIAKRLLEQGEAAILKGHWEPMNRTRPYAIHTPDDSYTYEDTLRAAGIHDRFSNHNSFMFEPKAMADLMLKMLRETGGEAFEFYKNETVDSVRTNDRQITEIHTEKHVFRPQIIIDCTGDIAVSRMAGCKSEIGPGVNGVTQVYRVTPKGYESIDAMPKEYLPPYSDPGFEKRLDDVHVISSINTYPDGDLNINQLPTMDGDEFYSMEQKTAEEICRGRVFLHWRRMQQDAPFMRKYRIKEVFPMIGIRESHRLAGRYCLTADDVMNGFGNQEYMDRSVAFSDHPIDIHGGDDPGVRILDKPYGILYDCLLPEEIDNLLTACRGSSFDRMTAASCRLSRTMLAVGEAAGTAAVVALDSKKHLYETDVNDVRELLGIPEFTLALKELYESPGQ